MISLGTRAKINRSRVLVQGTCNMAGFPVQSLSCGYFFFLLKFYLIYKPLWHQKSARPRGLGDQCSILSPRNFLWDSSHRELVGYQIHIGTLLLRNTLYGAQMKHQPNKPAPPKELLHETFLFSSFFSKCKRSDMVNSVDVCGQD